ncbi:hypothetical protein [[Phormidium] sp. ETS-05]|uniref:hypothetical protein n=1 Tax=[Phormidium] sp. ETS-05 TaxID=222819 RepID=UPI0018EED175|nr:hypothetical protein [[Phormidium] sp. ETS-05]
MTIYKLHFHPADFRLDFVIGDTASFSWGLDNFSVRRVGNANPTGYGIKIQ